MITLRLTAEDMAVMIKSASLTPSATGVITRSKIDGMHMLLEMDPEEARDLQVVLGCAVPRAGDRKDSRILKRLVHKLAERLDRIGEGLEIDPEDMARKILDHNTAPRDEFDGLSPAQVRILINTPWTTDTPGLQIHADVDPALLEGSDLLHNARLLLTALADGGTKATAVSGNLNRAFVERMLGAMRWPEGYEDECRYMNKVFNEEDVWELHELRVVLKEAGLIARRKGMMVATKKGRDLAAPDQAGRLLALVFETTFSRYNLAYGDRLPDLADFQYTISYPLAVLARLDGEWIDFDVLKGRLLLPAVAEKMPKHKYIDYEDRIIRSRLLNILESMGLIECRREPIEKRISADLIAVRKTAAYDRFIRLDLGE